MADGFIDSRHIQKLSLAVFLVAIAYSFSLNQHFEITSGSFVGRAVAFIDFHLAEPPLFRSDNSSAMYERLELAAEANPGLISLLYITSDIIGIHSHQLVLIPFGVFFTSLAYYTSFRGIFASSRIGCLSVLYILPYAITSPDQLGAYVAAWTLLAFVTVIYLSFRAMMTRPVRLILSMILLYIMVHLFWHTMEAQILFYLVSVGIITFIAKNQNLAKNVKAPYRTIGLCLLITLYFKDLLYRGTGYFASLSFARLSERYGNWIINILSRLGFMDSAETTTTVAGSEWYWYYETNPLGSISSIFNIVLVLTLAFPILLSLLVDMYEYKQNGQIPQPHLAILRYSIFITEPLLMMAYGLAGGASLRIVRFAYPIAALLSIQRLLVFVETHNIPRTSWLRGNLDFDTAATVFLVLIILLHGGVNAAGAIEQTERQSLTYSELDSSVQWQSEYTQTSDSRITDFRTAGKSQVRASSTGEMLNFENWRRHDYIAMRNGTLPEYIDYIYVDETYISSPVRIDQGWTPLQPIEIFINLISDSANRVYADGSGAIFAKKSD